MGSQVCGACLALMLLRRLQVKDRQIVAERMRAHVQAPDSTPLLIFPEGTCGARLHELLPSPLTLRSPCSSPWPQMHHAHMALQDCLSPVATLPACVSAQHGRACATEKSWAAEVFSP